MPAAFVSFNQANSDEYFVQITSGPTMGQWVCKLCTSRTFKDRSRHSKLQTHIDRVRVAIEKSTVAQTAVPPPGLHARIGLANERGLEASIFPEDAQQDEHDHHHGTAVTTDQPIFDEDMASSSDELESLYDPSHCLDFDLPESTPSSMDLDDLLTHPDNEERTTLPILEEETSSTTDTWLPWYPLRKKEVCIFARPLESPEIHTEISLHDPSQHVAALLMMGTGRNLMSTADYNRIRSILKVVLHVDLPDLGHMKNIRTDLKARLGLRILEKTSPLANRCFTLSVCDIISQELSNPEVCPHIEFLPEIDEGVTVDRYSQSKKWRECLSPSLRVQMVENQGEHFYIYEPAQLEDLRVVVPVFFYKDASTVMAKCLEVLPGCQGSLDFIIAEEPDFNSEVLVDVNVQTFATSFLQIELRNGQKWCESRNTRLLQNTNNGMKVVELPNAWRVRANGLLIRSVPIALYSDDTSGNVSKKWNKHMSFYFTLAGLRPRFTNQEYHIHPLCTSNIASALEQGDQIVDELNEAAANGFRAYDCMTEQEVLVIPFILCHMGDSPMHAEISNTTNPSGTLSPCRICDLTVESRADKQSETYVQQFVGIDRDWMPACQPLRIWARTREQTKNLWVLTQHPKSIKQFDDLSKTYGTRDSLNLPFAKEIQQLYRANKHKSKEDQLSQQDIIARCESLEDEFGEHMFNPFLRLSGFDGHMDTPVESLHVVLLGVTKYLYRDVISNLSPPELVAVTGRWQSFGIEGLDVAPIQPHNMVHYANSLLGKDFRVVLQAAPFVFFEFLPDDYRHCWISLVHLASYIFQTRIFDKQTPALFLTEKMESTNGITRQASVNSNHHAPGKDISNTFNNARLLRMLVSGGHFFDNKLRSQQTASTLFRGLFRIKEIRHSLGLHLQWPNQTKNQVKVKFSNTTRSRARGNECEPPVMLSGRWPHAQWKQGVEVVLANGQKVASGHFVLIEFESHSNSPIKIGRVDGIWQQVASDIVLLQVKKIKLLPGVHPFYGMREIKQTEHQAFIYTNNITCVLNVQHNCHDANCAVTKTRSYRIERAEANNKRPEVTHQQTNSFILNASAHYYSEYHRSVTDHIWSDVTPAEWEQSVSQGLLVWFDRCPPKGLGIDAVDATCEEDEHPGDITV
ncbi:hypothetical protein DFH28DRAFT_1201673 [Melampsora americana]|nr:hypothetical protein DFH28DRAFT_1201673 [Melampsora americana]